MSTEKVKHYLFDKQRKDPPKKGKERLTFIAACLVIPIIFPTLSALYGEPSTYRCYVDEKVLANTTTTILRAQSIPVFKLIAVNDYLYPWLERYHSDIAPIRDIDSLTNVLNVTKASDHYTENAGFRSELIKACINGTKIVIKSQLLFAYGLGGCSGVNDTADKQVRLPKQQVYEYCQALNTEVGIAAMKKSIGDVWSNAVCHIIYEQPLSCYKVFTNYQVSKSAMSSMTSACASIDSLVSSAGKLAKASSTQCVRVWWVGILDWVGSYAVKTAVVVFMSGVMWRYTGMDESREMSNLGDSLLDDQDGVTKEKI